MVLTFLATTKQNVARYYIEDKGENTCSGGSMIMDEIECEAACAELNINPVVSNKSKKKKPCYKAAKGKCRQDGRHGPRASLVCMMTIVGP